MLRGSRTIGRLRAAPRPSDRRIQARSVLPRSVAAGCARAALVRLLRTAITLGASARPRASHVNSRTARRLPEPDAGARAPRSSACSARGAAERRATLRHGRATCAGPDEPRSNRCQRRYSPVVQQESQEDPAIPLINSGQTGADKWDGLGGGGQSSMISKGQTVAE